MPPTGAVALRGSVFTRSRRDSRTQSLRSRPKPARGAPPRRRLIPAPQHRDGCRETTAHVEGQITPGVWNLPRAGLLSEMLVGFENLSHASRTNRMAIAN